MKCICDRTALNEALTAASAVIPTRTPKQILESVRLTVEKNQLVLTAYDQEVGIRYHVQQVEVKSTGDTLVRGDRFASIIRESGDETMALELADDHLHIRGRDSHFQIYTQDVKDFPPVPEMEGKPNLSIKAGLLQRGIERTLFAAARENTRYAINGVLWDRKDKRLNLVSTDGRRLALCGISLEKSVGDDMRAIVPTKTLALLGRLHFAEDEVLEVQLSSNQVILRSQNVTLSSVLVEGHFPKYEDVIPTGQQIKAEVPTADLQSAVRRASLLASAESKGVRMSLAREALVLASRAAEQGEAEIRMQIEYNGPDLVIGFNPEFILDGLKVSDETTRMEFQDSAKPGVFSSGTDFKYIIMPVNLS